MNKKQLEAFRRFRNNIQWLEENVANLKGYFENKELHFKEDLDVIEKVLNDYDRQRQKVIVYRTVIESNEDKLEAFELALKQPLAFAYLALFLCGNEPDSYEYWEKYNPNYFTKKEYNLLKKLLKQKHEEVKTNE